MPSVARRVRPWLQSTVAASGSSSQAFLQGAAARPCPLCFCADTEFNRCRPLHPSRSHAAFGYAACALAGGLWGTGFFFGKIAMREMSSAHMVLYRFLFACLGLSPILLRGRPGLDARGWRILLIAALPRRAGAVSAAVCRTGPHHGLPRCVDGRDVAGRAGCRRQYFCA